MRTLLNKKNKAGFTLVELMVVAIIVAILAAVAIPLMSGNRRRAAATEAEAALGTARSALRAVLAEHGAYNVGVAAGTVAGNVPGIQAGDFNGKYWQDANYTVVSLTASSYVLRATGSTNNNVTGVTIELNQLGDFTRTGL